MATHDLFLIATDERLIATQVPVVMLLGILRVRRLSRTPTERWLLLLTSSDASDTSQHSW